MRRGLAWLGLGLVAFVVLVVLSAPELTFSRPGALTTLLVVAVGAGLPGFLALVVVAVRRRSAPEPAPVEDREEH